VVTKTVPNSIQVSSGGSKVFLGSTSGLVLIDTTASNAVSVFGGVPGRVVAVSPGGVMVIIADAVNLKTYVFNTGNLSTDVLNISGVTAAAWTPDGLKAYMVAGGTLYQYAPSVFSLRTIAIGDTGESVGILPGAQFAYIATAGGNLGARSTCRTPLTTPNDSTYAPEATVSTDTGLQFTGGAALISGGTTAVPKMLDVGGTKMTVDTPTLSPPAPTTDCPPGIVSSAASADWTGSGIASFTPRQLIVLANGTQAYVTSNQAVLLGYDVAANTTFTVPVGGAAQFTGGALLDGTKVYVGATDGSVHVIDTATRLQSASVPISFSTSVSGATVCDNAAICKPDLVVVQPR
jgi:YVTN family beta-propeller protein